MAKGQKKSSPKKAEKNTASKKTQRRSSTKGEGGSAGPRPKSGGDTGSR